MKKANQVLALPDQRTYYNAVQLSLPVNTSIVLDQEDEVFSFLEAVEGVNFSRYVRPIRSNNTKSHDRGDVDQDDAVRIYERRPVIK